MFEARANTKEGLEKHAQLCSTVLDIFVNIGRKIGHILSVETWEIFLKLLIGITDLILRTDAPQSQEPLQRKLCSQLLKVLFELWLLSRTRNPLLWEALKERVRGWTHHMALVLTWKLTCISLTKRSVAILYGPSGIFYFFFFFISIQKFINLFIFFYFFFLFFYIKFFRRNRLCYYFN